MKLALVHDYLSEYGGAERVVEALPRNNASLPAWSTSMPRKGAYLGLRFHIIL